MPVTWERKLIFRPETGSKPVVTRLQPGNGGAGGDLREGLSGARRGRAAAAAHPVFGTVVCILDEIMGFSDLHFLFFKRKPLA